MQLSEYAEDYRKPKKGLAKHSAAAQRKRCRAASRADASPRSVRGRSENIKIKLTRRRRDLTDIRNESKNTEDKKIKQGGEWGWWGEKACNAGVNILFEANTKTLMINCQNSLVTVQVTPLTTKRILAIRADLKECLVEHSGLKLGKSERIFYAPLFLSGIPKRIRQTQTVQIGA